MHSWAVSSPAHRIGRIDFDNLNVERGYEKWCAYAQSKPANLLFTAELQRRADAAGKQVLALAAQPGLAATDLGQAGPRMAGRDGGSYYGQRLLDGTRGGPAPAHMSARAQDMNTARVLQDESARLTGTAADAL